ncbi:MAG TPA: DUF262 domain-containing protein [Burkholderiales bacterium]|nr:DUF262 domain-containing protein [Burkholderiales bacterium]
MQFAPNEMQMWVKTPRSRRPQLSDQEINEKYNSKAERIVTEMNREKLQNFYDALKRPGYMDTRPFYQRRQRWDASRQSKLIESLLINIPIPPLFVYEVKPNVYEVMDGQQRISAIRAFYSNELKLEGLERWPELNGKIYSKLPERIRAGIDRRSISWITLLNESAETDEEAMELKQLTFERLNTGGVELSAQEVRNSLYHGPFNDLLHKLTRMPQFRSAWGLPLFDEIELKTTPVELLDHSFYKKMDDIELVLRFFALRHADHYQKGMKGFLDLYMLRARAFTAEDLQILEQLFSRTLNMAAQVYGDKLFKPFNPKTGEWAKTPQRAYADAVLVAYSRFLDKEEQLIAKRDNISEMTKTLFADDVDGVLTGRGNTKKDVQDRITTVQGLISNALG